MKINRAHALFLVFAILGIVISLWSAEHWYSLQLGQSDGKSFCNVTDYWNCDRASLSDYAAVGSIPVGVFSAFYLFILIVLSFTQGIPGRLLSFLHIPPLIVSGFLVFKLIFELKTGCMVCYALDFCWLGAGISSLFFRPRSLFSSLAGLGVALVGSFLFALYPMGKWQDMSKLPSTEELDRFRTWFNSRPKVLIPSESPLIRPAKSSPKIQIVEFSDFACPHCARAAENLVPFLLAQQDVEFVFYPLPFDSSCHPDVKHSVHPNSCAWALVAICAEEQGAFWATHDFYYEVNESSSPTVSDENLSKLKSNTAELKECIEREETKKKLAGLIEQARKLDVNATPTFFVDGRKIQGIVDPRLFNILLEEVRSSR